MASISGLRLLYIGDDQPSDDAFKLFWLSVGFIR